MTKEPQRLRRWPGLFAAAICFLSYAYFWQSRDWNSASRLMLTYALVDRHTLWLDGLERQCADIVRDPVTGRVQVRGGDIAYHDGHFYSDKAPGLSLLGALPYACLPEREGLKPHPLDRPALTYWGADYWVTLFSSGLVTASTSYLVYCFVQLLGAVPGVAFWAALGYGLASPAFLYGTLFYGHNLAGFCLLAAMYLLWRSYRGGCRDRLLDALGAGLLAGYAVVAEYPAVGPAVLIALFAAGLWRRSSRLVALLIGAALTAALLATYNWKAFGNPFTLSYAYEASPLFRQVHSEQTPLGLRWWQPPEFERLPELLWLPRRGLAVYAPFLAFAPLGLIALLFSRRWPLALLFAGSLLWYVWIVLVYPNWDGGWCTGPRLLTATYPLLAVAAGSTFAAARSGVWKLVVVPVVLVGMLVNLGCVAVGGRFPPAVQRPLVEIVLARWRGQQDGFEVLAGGGQFEENAGRWLIRHLHRSWPEEEASDEAEVASRYRKRLRATLAELAGDEWSRWRPVEFVPLLALWAVSLASARVIMGR